MLRTISEHPVLVYTGGRPFDATRPVIVFIHGAGHDHSVWNFQARHFAHHGFSVLAPDLPGHGQSGGPPLASIEAIAGWIVALLDGLDVARATLVGHSMGSLVALQAAAQAGERVERLVLVGSVAPMPVAGPLLDAARQNRDLAHSMINQWSYSAGAQLGTSASPGMSLVQVNRRLMERQQDGVLANDLAACNAYANGLEAARSVRCPTAMICGTRDQMTPARAARPLFDALVNNGSGARMIEIEGSGHAMMAEAPDALTDSIRGFMLEK